MRKEQGSAGQRPATRQAYQNGRRRVKKGYVSRKKDRGNQMMKGKGISQATQASSVVSEVLPQRGHDTRHAEQAALSRTEENNAYRH